MEEIFIKGAREHNLKNINLKIPRNKLVVISGLSGSGKSSLAFDTIFIEGQRRYIESLPSYTRQQLDFINRPDIDSIEGLSPTIAISQKGITKNPRSTVGTITEIYDLLRILFAKIGIPHCPECGVEIKHQTRSKIISEINSFIKDQQKKKIYIFSPILYKKKNLRKILDNIKKSGYVKARINNKMYEVNKLPFLDKKKKHKIEILIDQFIFDKTIDQERINSSIINGLDIGAGIVAIEVFGQKKSKRFSEQYTCPKCGFSLKEINPKMFSFNNPAGACPKCHGIGYKKEIDPDLIIPNKNLSFAEGAIKPWTQIFSHMNLYGKIIESIANQKGFSIINRPIKDLNKNQLDLILYGNKNKKNYFEGIIPSLQKRYEETSSEYIKKEIEKYMTDKICSYCKGKRLKKEILNIKIENKSIADISDLTISENIAFFKNLKNKLSQRQLEIVRQIISEILKSLNALSDVSLNYLTLSRIAGSLAGGEAQRIKLANQINSGLSGVIYVLDEPSIGLHPRDHQKLIEILKRLKNAGNSVIVVEHDLETIKNADYLIDVGPGAGEKGGKIVAKGKPSEVAKKKDSITGQYLAKTKKIEPFLSEKKPEKFIKIIGASEFNLKNIDVEIPVGFFVGISGVSGSGKSTLISEILVKALRQKIRKTKTKPGKFKKIIGAENINNIINVDQSPIGRSPRSNPATYIGFFTQIRELFASVPESKLRGYKPGSFSFNVKGGRCETCKGEGEIKIEMSFLSDVYAKCPDCQGKRYSDEVLEIHYQGKNISEILDMTVEQAYNFFKKDKIIKEKLKVLKKVGLSYIRLGQPAPQLSGGEAQRIKLASELIHRNTGNTLYILDEPTTGLHLEDIKNLLEVIKCLIDSGNTVLVIEHHLDVLKCCQWLIDLGPEGGDKGGELVACGTPKEIAQNPKSYTGQFLKKVL